MRFIGYVAVAILLLVLPAGVASAHEYKIAGGPAIPPDIGPPPEGITTIRTFRMSKGEALFLLVTDQDCTARISTQNPSNDVVKIQKGQMSNGAVKTHRIKLKAKSVGTYMFEVRVVGKDVEGEGPCQENSVNQITIEVVENPEDIGDRVSPSLQLFTTPYKNDLRDFSVQLKGEYRDTRDDLRSGSVDRVSGIWGSFMSTLEGLNDSYMGFWGGLSGYRSDVNSGLSSAGTQTGDDPRTTSPGGCGDFDELFGKFLSLNDKQIDKLNKEFKKLLRGIETDSERAGDPVRVNYQFLRYDTPSLWGPGAAARSDDPPPRLQIGVTGTSSGVNEFGLGMSHAWFGGIADPAKGTVEYDIEGSDGSSQSGTAPIEQNGTWCAGLDGFLPGVQLRFRVNYTDDSGSDTEFNSTPGVFVRIQRGF